MKTLALLLLVVLAGCCDVNCDCRKPASDALIAATAAQATAKHALDSIGAINSTGQASPAGQAALLVLHDPAATQDRKAQALQLLFELERGKRLDDTVQRLDELAAKLEVVLERKVEADDR